jgi:hypothetical protein
MRAIRENASFPQADSEQPGAKAAITTDGPRSASQRIDWDALKTAGRSCCCPSQPAVIAILPPTPSRNNKTDLLLCMHHYRLSRQALQTAGAIMINRNRELIAPDAPAYLSAD